MSYPATPGLATPGNATSTSAAAHAELQQELAAKAKAVDTMTADNAALVAKVASLEEAATIAAVHAEGKTRVRSAPPNSAAPPSYLFRSATAHAHTRTVEVLRLLSYSPSAKPHACTAPFNCTIPYPTTCPYRRQGRHHRVVGKHWGWQQRSGGADRKAPQAESSICNAVGQ